MKPPILSFVHSLGVLSAAVLFAGTQQARAATYVWVGGGANNNWSTAANWTTSPATNTAPANPAVTVPTTQTTPLAGVDAITLTGSSSQTTANVDQNWYIQSLAFNSVADFTLTGGNTLTIRPENPTVGHDSRVFLSSTTSSTKTINNNIKVLPALTTPPQTSDGSGFGLVSGTVILNGNLDVNGLSGFRVSGGAGTAVINGAISSTTGWAINSAATLVLNNANNSFGGGGMTVWSGILKIGTQGAMGGVGGITMGNPGDATFKSTVLTTSAVSVTQAISIAAAANNTRATNEFATLGTEGTGLTTFSGAITSSASGAIARAMTFTAGTGARVDFTNNISRASGATGILDTVTKTGNGIVSIGGGTNNWQGQTNVNAGTLLVNGTVQAPTDRATSMVIVSSNAALGGAGTLNRDVLLAGGSTFSPGNMSGVTTTSLVGTLTIGGNLDFDNVSNILNFDLGTPALSDKVAVNGNLFLAGTLNILDAGGFGAGTYDLFTYTGSLTAYNPANFVVGTNPNSAYTYTIDTSAANTVRLLVTAVPEPSRAILLLLGCATLVMRRKRKSISLGR